MISLTTGQKYPGALHCDHVKQIKGRGPHSTAGSACISGAQNILSIQFQGGGALPSKWASLLLHPNISGQIQGFQASSFRAQVLVRTAEECQLRTLPLCRGHLSKEPHQVYPWQCFHCFLRSDSFSEHLCSIRWFTAFGDRIPCTIWFGWRYCLEVQTVVKDYGQGALVERSSVWEASRTTPRDRVVILEPVLLGFILSAHELTPIHGSLSHPLWPGSLSVMVSLPSTGQYFCILRKNLWSSLNWN